ncbi:MAG: hypothetical protein V1930_06505 [Pseudomonadota bacterium]
MRNEKRLILWSIIATGISSVSVQLVTIREFLSQFHGNEISISLVLFCWLLLTGIGSLTSNWVRTASLTFYSLLTFLIALWPIPQILFIRFFRETVFIHGVSPGFYQILLYILITTLPYCLMVGFVLPYALKVLMAYRSSFTSGKLYIMDSMGDIIGGILFSFFLVYWFTPFKTIAFTSSFLIVIALLLFSSSRRYLILIAALPVTLVFYFFSLNGSFERATLLKQYGDIVRYMESPYGRIVITREGPQHTFWESGVPLYSDANVMSSEEKVHYPLIQLERVKSVLLISGGLGETLVEVSKYHPERLDYVELDPHMTNMARELKFIKETPSLSIMNTDGRHYLKETKHLYDAIIMDLPDPDTFQINRFFTKEFFSLAKRRLSRGGILSFGLSYSPNYISEARKKKLSSIYHTAKFSFKNVMVIPGEEALFLCRDGELHLDIPERLKENAIKTAYIEGFYYGNVTPERMRQLQESLNNKGMINEDFKPTVVSVVFQEWFMTYGSSPKPFFIVLLGLSIFYLIFIKKEEYVLFSTGMVAMGAEMLVIFTFQVLFGYIYLKIGAIITLFLSGLLPGAILGMHYKKRDKGNLVVSEIILLSLLLIFLLWVHLHRGEIHQLWLLAYCFVFSFFCGFQFPLVARMIGEEKNPAAKCLTADLIGAAVGTLATGTILIPVWGIHAAIIFLILIKISSSIVIGLSSLRSQWMLP